MSSENESLPLGIAGQSALDGLLESEQRYRLLVENLNDGVVISQDEHFIFFNNRFAEMLEYEQDELRALTYRDVYTDRGQEILYARGHSRERGESVPPIYETEFRTKGGRAIPVQANVAIISFEGRPATFAIIRDISQQRRTEHEEEVFQHLALGLARTSSLEELGELVRTVTGDLFGWHALFFTCRLSGRTRFRTLLRIDTVDNELLVLPATDVHVSRGSFMANLKAGTPTLINREPTSDIEEGLESFGEKSRRSASLIYAPLHRGPALLAVLSVQSYTPNRYSARDAQTLQRLVNAVGPTVERLVTERRSSVFLDLGRKLSVATTPVEAARIIVDVADKVVGWDACFVDLYDPSNNLVEPILLIDEVDGKRQEFSVASQIYPPGRYLRQVLDKGPLRIEREVKESDSEAQDTFGDKSRPSESMLFAPLVGRDGIFGFLSTQSYMVGAYDDEDLAVVEALASHCSGALVRTRAQNELLKSESRYRRVVEAVETVIMGLSRDYRITEWNRQAERLYGYSRAEVLGQHYVEVFTPREERSCVHDRFEAAMEGDVPGEFEATVRCKDGGIRFITWTAALSYDAEGRVIGLLCCGQDSTERKQWERELQKSEAYYRAIIEDQSELIVRFLPDGIITFVNEAYCAYHGAERWQLMGTNLFTPECPGHRQDLKSHLTRLNRDRPIASIQNHIVDGYGVTRWQEWTDRAIHNGVGELLGYQSVGRDISRLRTAQEALLRSQERYLKLLESSSDVIFQITIDGLVAYVNHACLTVLGEEPRSFIDDPDLFPTLIHPESLPRYEQSLALFLSGKRIPTDSEPFAWQRRDGKTVYTENRIGVLFGADGHPESMLAVCRDVTDRVVLERERRELEVQIQQTQKLESMSVLAGGIAHDFNNLLTGILGNASLILADLSPDQPAYEHTEQLRTAATRAADLTRQMLAYAGKGTFVVQPLNLTEAVREMTGILKTVISPRAKLELFLLESLPYVLADATQISQIVMNLITNASDALEGREGRICLSTGIRRYDEVTLAPLLFGSQRPPGEYVYLEVRDNGCGMDDATKARIFDPFFTRKPTGLVGGRGLGLAAVLGIVRNHQGAIHVASQPDVGTTFTIIFPRSTYGDSPNANAANRPIADTTLRSGLIMVVDDEVIVQRVARGALTRAGYEVITAGDGQEAVIKLSSMEVEPIAIIMDLRMPQMDGHALCSHVRTNYPGVAVVIMSGFTEREVHEDESREDGGITFIEKPFSPSDLLAALDKAIKAKTEA